MNKVARKENGSYEINGKKLTPSEADAIYRFVEHEYNRADVVSALETYYEDNGVHGDVTIDGKIVEAVTLDYERVRDNSEDWTYDMDYAIREHKDEIDKAIEACKDKERG